MNITEFAAKNTRAFKNHVDEAELEDGSAAKLIVYWTFFVWGDLRRELRKPIRFFFADITLRSGVVFFLAPVTLALLFDLDLGCGYYSSIYERFCIIYLFWKTIYSRGRKWFLWYGIVSLGITSCLRLCLKYVIVSHRLRYNHVIMMLLISAIILLCKLSRESFYPCPSGRSTLIWSWFIAAELTCSLYMNK